MWRVDVNERSNHRRIVASSPRLVALRSPTRSVAARSGKLRRTFGSCVPERFAHSVGAVDESVARRPRITTPNSEPSNPDANTSLQNGCSLRLRSMPTTERDAHARALGRMDGWSDGVRGWVARVYGKGPVLKRRPFSVCPNICPDDVIICAPVGRSPRSLEGGTSRHHLMHASTLCFFATN